MGLRLIGLSVSACIYDIAVGEVDMEDVVCIVGGTRMMNREEIVDVVRHYRDNAWRTCREKATSIFYELMDSGRIIQPRAVGAYAVPIPGLMVWAVQVDRKMLKTIKLMQQMEENDYGKEDR